MEHLITLSQVANICSGVLKSSNGNELIKGISIDDKSIQHGFLFFAFEGEKFDGHSFVPNAIENGAVCCVVKQGSGEFNNTPVIVVKDVLESLQNLAKYYRSLFSALVIGVTGSVGKTSTKEMLFCVLSKKYIALKTLGNHNSQIGLAMTVFNITSAHQVGVLEMGMSKLGELSRLSEIAKPDSVVITNIGLSHIESLKTKENILKAKLEIFDAVDSDGFAVLNGDDELLWSNREKLKVETIYYGIYNKECDILAYDINTYSLSTEFKIKLDGSQYKIKINEPGIHQVYNALASIAIGIRYNLTIDDIIEAISDFASTDMRQKITNFKGLTLIIDCYNASPHSMSAAIDVLDKILCDSKLNKNKARSVAILGDMLSLGDFAKEEHEKLGNKIYEKGIDFLIFIGDYGTTVATSAINAGFEKENIKIFKNCFEANKIIISLLKEGDIVLAKGSREVHLEETINKIKQDFNKQ